MKLITLLLLLSAACLRAESIEGDLKLTYSDDMFAKNAFKKEFGKVVKATTDWHVGDFFGEQTVFAAITVKNTGTKPMYFQYYVAFFDKDKKLIGSVAVRLATTVKPGRENQSGSP
jgi:hypothetical protein